MTLANYLQLTGLLQAEAAPNRKGNRILRVVKREGGSSNCARARAQSRRDNFQRFICNKGLWCFCRALIFVPMGVSVLLNSTHSSSSERAFCTPLVGSAVVSSGLCCSGVWRGCFVRTRRSGSGSKLNKVATPHRTSANSFANTKDP
jgi:hypothetical protein